MVCFHFNRKLKKQRMNGRWWNSSCGVAHSMQVDLGVTLKVCRPNAGFYLANMVSFKSLNFSGFRWDITLQFNRIPAIFFSFHFYAILIYDTCLVPADGSTGLMGPSNAAARGDLHLGLEPHRIPSPCPCLLTLVLCVAGGSHTCDGCIRGSTLLLLAPRLPGFAGAKFNCSCFIRCSGIFSPRNTG